MHAPYKLKRGLLSFHGGPTLIHDICMFWKLALRGRGVQPFLAKGHMLLYAGFQAAL
jgi:hypothetical protein